MVRTPFIDKNGIKRGAWSEDEDNKLRAFVERFGHPNWRQLPKYAGLMRCGKSCRLRWMNYLRPNLKKGNYSLEEDQLIIKLHNELGNRWSAIAEKLGGRSDNDVKNHWHAHLKKRVRFTNTNSSQSGSCQLNEQNVAATLTYPEVSSSDHLYSLFNGLTDNLIEQNQSIEQLSFFTSFETDSFSWTNNIETESFDLFSIQPFDNFWTKPFF
ncbi:hypothetical protein MTR67_032523 [Solanum verrucosum]|uniref:Uncharacterized protein n=1 Tax=Solanum verrucosum TaxID=315347 RepID=A0AAF0ZI15_SOLVR|nr:transcription factor MYB58-like [Solanum verrucosum]WMV39138.1 hypothetical protein MTR67_032523 [Solanum verrucosum]